MTKSPCVRLCIACVMMTVAVPSRPLSGQEDRELETRVDGIFAKWTTSTPGCAVGAAVNGRRTLAKAYGMADLEHDVRITPETIFEAGSVSKQFTAAAVLLLAKDGKLSLDDSARTYIPELPDYGTPITIRHMLTHTSGLRDWGSVAAVAGRLRWSSVYTHAHVLDIVSRQRSLNFRPGTRWSYSNTGYNLAAILVSRVSGMSFAEFTRRRIFEPLGMTHTSWRDDHTRVVKTRAIAYMDEPDGFHIKMPFENVHGNGGLLTTVGDLMKWNANFASPTVGDLAFVTEEQQAGRFNDGREFGYALGLFIGRYHGRREVSHSGGTAGYSSDLIRYPDHDVSVAVLCNVNSAASWEYSRAVADLYLARRLPPSASAPPSYTLTSADIDHAVGLYRSTVTGAPISIMRGQHTLSVELSGFVMELNATSPSHFVLGENVVFDLDPDGDLSMSDAFGTVIYERVPPATARGDALRAYVGSYVSDEAETILTIAVEGDALVDRRRPDTVLTLRPRYADVFSNGELGTVVFRRDARGRPKEFSVVQERVWDLRFTRQTAQ